MRTTLAAAFCAALLAGFGGGASLAGEVKGPPSAKGEKSENYTAARTRANSICAYSGLNDDRTQVGDDAFTQTPAEGPPGLAGLLCQGGSNPNRDIPS